MLKKYINFKIVHTHFENMLVKLCVDYHVIFDLSLHRYKA